MKQWEGNSKSLIKTKEQNKIMKDLKPYKLF